MYFTWDAADLHSAARYNPGPASHRNPRSPKSGRNTAKVSWQTHGYGCPWNSWNSCEFDADMPE